MIPRAIYVRLVSACFMHTYFRGESPGGEEAVLKTVALMGLQVRILFSPLYICFSPHGESPGGEEAVLKTVALMGLQVRILFSPFFPF